MASRFSQSSVVVVSNHLDDCASSHEDGDLNSLRRESETASSSYENATATTTTSMAYLPQTIVLCELRHDAFEARTPTGPSVSGLVSKWRPKDRVSSSFSFCLLQMPFVFLILMLKIELLECLIANCMIIDMKFLITVIFFSCSGRKSQKDAFFFTKIV